MIEKRTVEHGAVYKAKKNIFAGSMWHTRGLFFSGAWCGLLPCHVCFLIDDSFSLT